MMKGFTRAHLQYLEREANNKANDLAQSGSGYKDKIATIPSEDGNQRIPQQPITIGRALC